MLLEKIGKVIESSNTLEQLKGSKAYLNLAFDSGCVSFHLYNLYYEIIIKKEEILKKEKNVAFDR